MPVKISELTAATTLTGTELVPLVQGGTTKRTTVAAFSSLITPAAAFNGTTDDTAAWQAAVDAVALAGGGVLTAPAGKSSLITGAINITSSNISFYFPAFSFKLSGSASFSALSFAGTGSAAVPVLGSDAAAYATQISVSTLGGLVAGSWLLMQKTSPGSATYYFIARVRSVSGGGPWTISLELPLPIAFAAADAGLNLKRLGVLENVGVDGNLTIDGSGSSGTTVHGVQAHFVVNSSFAGIKGLSLSNGAALYGIIGGYNDFCNIQTDNCGNASFGAIQYLGQTASQFSQNRCYDGTGFGVQLTGTVYCTGDGLVGTGCQVGRGVKLQASLFSAFSNVQGNFNAANGIAVSLGSCHNVITGAVAAGNAVSEGLWFSDQSNCNNQIIGFTGYGNASRDIYIGTTDLGNSIVGADCGVIEVHNATTVFSGLRNNTSVTGDSPVGISPTNLLNAYGASVVIGVTAVETTLSTDTILANSLGKNGVFTAEGTIVINSTADNKVTRLKFGGVTLATFTQTTTTGMRWRVTIQNANATNVQNMVIESCAVGGTWTYAIPTAGAIDTTADTTFVVTGQKATAGDTLTQLQHFAEVRKS